MSDLLYVLVSLSGALDYRLALAAAILDDVCRDLGVELSAEERSLLVECMDLEA